MVLHVIGVEPRVRRSTESNILSSCLRSIGEKQETSVCKVSRPLSRWGVSAKLGLVENCRA